MRLIDLDDPDVVFCGHEGEYLCYNIWEELPTVDAVPVVRCWECKWYCDGHCGWRQILDELPEDFYCPDGKRKETDE